MPHLLTLWPLGTYSAALCYVQPHTMENNDHGNIEVQNILHPIARVACLEANIWCIYLITASPHMWDWSLSTSHSWSMISQTCVGCVCREHCIVQEMWIECKQSKVGNWNVNWNYSKCPCLSGQCGWSEWQSDTLSKHILVSHLTERAKQTNGRWLLRYWSNSLLSWHVALSTGRQLRIWLLTNLRKGKTNSQDNWWSITTIDHNTTCSI